MACGYDRRTVASSLIDDDASFIAALERDAARWSLVVTQTLAGSSAIQNPASGLSVLKSKSNVPHVFGTAMRGFDSVGDAYHRRTVLDDVVGTFRNILGPFFVDLVSESVRQAGKFSLHMVVPFHRRQTQQGKEMLGVVLQCANYRTEQIETMSLGLYEIESLSGQHIYEGLGRVMDLYHFSWDNFVGLSISGDRLPEDSKVHLLDCLRGRKSEIICFPRLCRVLSSSITSAISTYLGEELLVCLKNVYHYFLDDSWRTVDDFVDFCEAKGCAPEKVRLEVEKLRDPIVTRDGYIYPCLRVLGSYHFQAWEFFRPDQANHRSVRLKNSKDYGKISDFLSDNENVCHLIILKDVLEEVFEVVQEVEKDELQLFDVGRAVEKIMSGLRRRMIPAGFMEKVDESHQQLLRCTYYNVESGRLYDDEAARRALAGGEPLRSLETLLEGTSVDSFFQKFDFMRRLNEFGLVRKGVEWRCRKVVWRLLDDLRNEFKDVLDLLGHLEVMKPTAILSSMLPDELREKLQNVVQLTHGLSANPGFVDKLADEMAALHHCRPGFDEDDAGLPPGEFWFRVKDVMGGMLEVLPDFALDIFCLPHCGRSTEIALNLLEVFQMYLDRPDYKLSLLMLNARLVMDAARKLCGSNDTGDNPFPEDLVARYVRNEQSKVISDPSANIGLMLVPVENEKRASKVPAAVPERSASWIEVPFASAMEALARSVASSGIDARRFLTSLDVMSSGSGSGFESEDAMYGRGVWNDPDDYEHYRPYDEFAPDDYYDSDEDRRAVE